MRGSLQRLVVVAISAVVLLVMPNWAIGEDPPSEDESLCGGDPPHKRWLVKTLQDRPQLIKGTKLTTVRELNGLDPEIDTSSREVFAGQPRGKVVEMTKYRVENVVLKRISEKGDGDIHLVIADPDDPTMTMVTEFPRWKCTKDARLGARRKMRRARRAVVNACPNATKKGVAVMGKATIVGVGFFDRPHRVGGAARNFIELHPVLRFKGTCERYPTRP